MLGFFSFGAFRRFESGGTAPGAARLVPKAAW